MKKDGDKPSLELIPRECLEGMGYVLKFGAEKYDRHLWREGMEWSRLLGGAMRHITAFNDGEDLDPESGQSHLYHAMCCLAFIGTYQATKTGNDDRHKPTKDLCGSVTEEEFQKMIDTEILTDAILKLPRYKYDELMNIKAIQFLEETDNHKEK